MLGSSCRTALAAILSLVSLGGAFNLGQKRVRGDSPLSIGYVRPFPTFTFVSYVIRGLIRRQVIFPGFEPLDIWGPMEILFSLSGTYNMTLSTVSFESGPVSARLSRPFTIGPNGTRIDPKFALNPTMLATHSFDNAPELDLIIVPGGIGDFLLDNENNFGMENFIASRFDRAQYVLSVCTGATTLARAGILNGQRATTNKAAWAWATDPRHGSNIEWVPNARWIANEKIWTSSGVAAGMDMMYAFLSYYYGSEYVNSTLNGIEYVPHTDPNWDPFAVVHNVSVFHLPARTELMLYRSRVRIRLDRSLIARDQLAFDTIYSLNDSMPSLLT
jgi:putative intracellular protease/amidase